MRSFAPMRTPLLALALLLAASATVAEERWYELELIVFARLGEPPVTEVWPDDPGAPDVAAARVLLPVEEAVGGETIELLEQPAVTTFPLPGDDAATDASGDPGVADAPLSMPPEPFRLLDVAGHQLAAEAALLERAGHEILFHGAWRQPVVDPELAELVRLGGAEPPFTDGGTGTVRAALPGASGPPAGLDEHAIAMLLEELGIDTAQPDPAPGPAPFEGVVRLGVKRYLHLLVDLVLRREVPVEVAEERPAADVVVAIPLELNSQETATAGMPTEVEPAVGTTLRTYRLRESRRMRSGSLHYFDHPAFGVLALATRHELPPPPESLPETLLPETSATLPGTAEDAQTTPATVTEETGSVDGNPGQ